MMYVANFSAQMRIFIHLNRKISTSWDHSSGSSIPNHQLGNLTSGHFINLTSGHFIPHDRSRVRHTYFETKIYSFSQCRQLAERRTTSTYPCQCLPWQCSQPKERPYSTVIQNITLHINFQGVSHMLINSSSHSSPQTRQLCLFMWPYVWKVSSSVYIIHHKKLSLLSNAFTIFCKFISCVPTCIICFIWNLKFVSIQS